MTTLTSNWWKTGTVYQIWPASYKDSNEDGVGDIPGIIGTLSYLKDLGIDVIWISPMYESPQKDFGYDVSNYEEIHRSFGTLQDMDLLIKECHRLGMKILLDLVVNHTSDAHVWFQESRSSKTNTKADWYIWRDPKIIDGKRCPPNNWASFFGGSAWEYVPERNQYYLHLFLACQPDLNWENVETRQAIYRSAVEFWLARGIDGFRIDTVNLYSKNIEFPDTPVTAPDEEYQMPYDYVCNGPRIHEWLQEQRKVIDKYGDVFLVGEMGRATPTELRRYLSLETRELDCIIHFDVTLLGTNYLGGAKKHQIYKPVLPVFKEAWRTIQDIHRGVDVWTTSHLENHDQPRSLDRYATDDPEYHDRAAKVLATLLCCMTGTLFVYQGQEIGMTNFPKSWGIEEIKDPASVRAYQEIDARFQGDPLWLRKIMQGLQYISRDNARLPVQRDSSPHAGFTTGQPWIRVHDNYPTINVADQQTDPLSPLNFWKQMLKLRKEYADLTIFGDFEVWDTLDLDTFAFTKRYRGGEKAHTLSRQLCVFLNFSSEDQPLYWPLNYESERAQLLVSSVQNLDQTLSPWESKIYLLEN